MRQCGADNNSPCGFRLCAVQPGLLCEHRHGAPTLCAAMHALESTSAVVCWCHFPLLRNRARSGGCSSSSSAAVAAGLRYVEAAAVFTAQARAPLPRTALRAGKHAPGCLQEVKQAKLRRSQGHPPVPLRAQAESGLPSSAALGAAASTSSAGASSAGASSLPWLPQGCTWGYRTPEGFFVAFDPSTGAAGEPTRVVQKNALHGTPSALRPPPTQHSVPRARCCCRTVDCLDVSS